MNRWYSPRLIPRDGLFAHVIMNQEPLIVIVMYIAINLDLSSFFAVFEKLDDVLYNYNSVFVYRYATGI